MSEQFVTMKCVGNLKFLTVSKASPFDYWNHALLYLPEDMPFPNTRKTAYRKAVADRLEGLIRQSHGHTLALFTSYRLTYCFTRTCGTAGNRIF